MSGGKPLHNPHKQQPDDKSSKYAFVVDVKLVIYMKRCIVRCNSFTEERHGVEGDEAENEQHMVP